MPKGKKPGQRGKEKAPTASFSKEKSPPQEEESVSREVGETNLGSPLSEQDTSKFSEAQDERIAAFFEDLPAFYDMTNTDYKKKVKKNALLKEFADEIGLAPSKIMTRFRTMRTDYFKLRAKQQKGKSGKGQTRLTPLQEFKLKRYSFLAPHYRGRTNSSVLGSVAQPECSSDEPDQGLEPSPGDGENLEGSAGAKSQESQSTHPAHKKNKKDTKKDLAEVLVELLSDSRKELKQSQAAVAEASASISPSTSRLSERDAWAQWLSSVHEDIPPEVWRAYQQETFLVAMRYVRQHQGTQHQQQQYAFVAPQPPHQQHQQQFLMPQWPQQQQMTNLHQQALQRMAAPRVRSAPVPTSSCQHTFPGILSQTVDTIQASTSGSGGVNFNELFGSATQTETSTTTCPTDSFSEVLDGFTRRDSAKQTQSHSLSDTQADSN